MRRKGIKRRRIPESVEDVQDDVRRLVFRQKRGGPNDLASFDDEIESLVTSISEFRSEWVESPCVHRVAMIETGFGTTPFEDTVFLPAVEHTYEMELEMLDHIRRQKGLPTVKMPLFVHPDEIELALRPVEPVSPAAVLAGLPEKELEKVSDRRRKKLRRRRDLAETRRAVLDRDDWECRQCGNVKDLQLYRVNEDLDEHDIDAYVALCRACLPPEARETVFRGRRLEPDDVRAIRSQLVIVFQDGSIERIGFVLANEYTVLAA